MSKIDIKNFYKTTVERKEFNSDFWNEVKKISTEGELKAFIEEKVQPVAKKMGYDFSTKDLLNYEKQMARRITEQQLEAVSGGVSAKNWALGGIFSLMALGAGIIGTTNSASAELTTQDVAKSTEIMETAIAEEFENPKILPIQGENEIEEAKKDKETSQTNVDKSVNKKDVKIQATKSWYRNWLYLTTDSNSTETLTLTRSMLESFLKEAGFSSIYEIQAIQARNAKGEILDVKLDKDLGKLFSESKEIPGKLWGTWGKANPKKDISDADAEQTVVETPGSGTEQSTIGPSDLRDEQVVSDVSDLETAKAATDVDPKEVFETRKLTDGQQLYAYEALNLQEAYALLKSGVVENVRFCGNITEIATKNGRRLYSGDKGDAFIELLYMLYPSPAGTLNTNTGYKGRDSFAMYGGMSPELAAKFFAILNDCRNKKIEIPKNTTFTLKKDVGKESFHYYVNSEFKRVLIWLKDKGLLTDKDIEDVIKEAERHEKSLNELDISRLRTKFDYIKKALGCKKGVTAYFGGEEKSLKRKLGNENTNLEIIKELEDVLKKELTEEDLKNDTLVKAKLTEQKKDIEDVIKAAEGREKSLNELDISKLKTKFGYIEEALKRKKDVVAYFKKEEEKLKRKLGNENTNLEIIKELEDVLKKELTEEDLKNDTLVKAKLTEQKEVYKDILKELNSKAESIENSEISKKAKFLMHFINTMKEATKLEVTDGSSYPKYLTEHILMSYMCQTLNSSEDVRELYQKIAEQLSQNRTNKAPTPEEEKSEIVAKIAAKKEEIARLNDIINVVAIQELSPYKSATQSNDIIPKIGSLETNGNVQIQKDTFSDCADIAARHVINLLTFANEQNWDLILNGANIKELNVKLKEVIDAINNNRKVKFYDLKTRLQMFFLYQRGFIEGVDNEEDREYRSKNGADDVTPLARTLWEYVICNMNEENLAKGPDKDESFYSIAYAYGKNHELDTGYANMLKLMWNMAKALNLQSGKLDSAKKEIDALSSLKEYDETAFKKALSSTFDLFNESDGIEFTLSDCKYEGDKVTGNVTVGITKADQRLNFTIYHGSGHGEIKHNPVNFNFYKYLKKYCKDEILKLAVLTKLEKGFGLNEKERDLREKIIKGLNETLNNFEKLLLRSSFNYYAKYRITPLNGFYGAFSGEELKSDDAFRNTDLYKKYKALSAFKTLRGEENNVDRINLLLDIETMRGAKKVIVIQDGKRQEPRNLSDILYEKYLKTHKGTRDVNGEEYSNIDNSICFHDFGEIEEIYDERGEKQKNMNYDIIKINEGGEVQLFIKNIPENGKLIIPSTVYGNGEKKYRVVKIDKYSNVNFEGLKTLKYTGDFDNLEINQRFYDDAKKNLQTVEINGNIKNLMVGEWSFFHFLTLKKFIISGNIVNLTIGDMAFGNCEVLNKFIISGKVESLKIGDNTFDGCRALNKFIISGNIVNLAIKRESFSWCRSLKTFTIQGNVGNLTMEKDAFYRCENLKKLIIRGNVEKLDIASDFLNSLDARIFLPENLKNKIPENFEEKDKIVFYNIIDNRTLHFKANMITDRISLDKKTLETLGGSFQILQAKNSNEEIIEVIFDDDLKDEFLKIEDATGLHYERKRV